MIEQLKKILQNPDDLSAIPDIIKGIEELEKTISDMEKQLQESETKIGELHELNRKYLKMIPIKDEVEEQKEEEEKVDIDDAVNEILEEVVKNG